MQAETVRFLRERVLGDHALLAVSWLNEDGRPRSGVFGASRDSDGGWRVSGGAWGSDAEPAQTEPWANLGRWGGGSDAFWAGGRVHGEVRRLRVVDRRGRALEDEPEEGVVLVMTPGRFDMPATVELYDAVGGLLRTQALP